MAEKKRMPVAQVITISLTAVAAILLVAGFFTPPMGKIDGSVLQGAGVMLGFAALWVGAEAFLERGADAKFAIGAGGANASVDIHTDNDEEK